MVSEPIRSQAPVSAASALEGGDGRVARLGWALARIRSRFGSMQVVFSGVRMNSAPALRASRTRRWVVSILGAISRPGIQLDAGDGEGRAHAVFPGSGA